MKGKYKIKGKRINIDALKGKEKVWMRKREMMKNNVENTRISPNKGMWNVAE